MNFTSQILSDLSESGRFESFALRCCLCSFLLLVGVWFAVWCLRHSSAALRHRILLLGSAGVLSLPVMIPLTHGWNPTIWLRSESERELVPPMPNGSVVEHENSPLVNYESDIAMWSTDPFAPAEHFEDTSVSIDSGDQNQVVATSELVPSSPNRSQTVISSYRANIRIENLFAAVWFIGTLLLSLRLVAQRLLIDKIVRTAIPITDSRTLAILDAFNRSNTSVTLLCSETTQVPIAVGILRPAIVLPTGYGKWSDDRLRIVLMHELTHIDRCDVLAQSVARVACVLYWFNPLVWQAARRMQLERELACDDVMLCSGENPNDYADHLIEIASAVKDRWRVPQSASAMATHTNLQTRVRHLLQSDLDRRLVSKRASTLLLTLASVFLTLLAITFPSIATMPVDDPQKSEDDASATEVTLTGDEVRDWSERLTAMPNVRKLTIRRPAIEQFNVNQLKGFKQLTSFRAEDFPLESKLADTVAANLAMLPNLQTVTFQRTGLTSRGLQTLRSSSLTELELNAEELITDDGFEHISKMPSLRKLVLDATPIEVAGLKHLQECSRLRSFALRRHPAGSIQDGADQRLAAIAGLSTLEELEIESTAYTRLIVLKRIKSLKQLTLRRCGASEASRSLKQLTQLDKLVLDNCAIRNETLDDVKNALEEIGIEVVDGTPPAAIDLLTRTAMPVNEATKLARQLHDELNVAKHHPTFWVRWRSHSSTVPSMKAEPIRTVHRLKKTLSEDHVDRPYTQENIMAWAPQQFYTVFQHFEDDAVVWEQIKYGDAEVAWSREGDPQKLLTHVIRNGVSEFVDSPLIIPLQLRVSEQTYWWGVGTRHQITKSLVSPQQATYTELTAEEFFGETCRVLESAGRSERLWVSKQTGRLRGSLSYIHQGFFIPFYKQDIVTQIVGYPITSRDEYRTLFGDGKDAITKQKQRQLSLAWTEYNFNHAIPNRLNVFSDYREIAPGRWFPFHVQSAGSLHNKQNQGRYDYNSFECVVTKVAVDRGDLKKYWAAMLPKEGADVQDQRFSVPVDYKYRHDRTEDEIQSLVIEKLFEYAHSQVLITEQTSPIKKMVGKPAPALPTERWLGERPNVKDKRYLIHCWAAWCAPCKNDVPLLNSISKNRIVIGIHPSGTDLDQIRKTAKDAKMSYPTVVAPPGSKDIFGYPVKLFPYCIEVDEDGNVVKHGTLHELLGSNSKAISTAELPPNVSGVVLGTQSEKGLVAISLGEADGVKKGQVFNVIREGHRVAQLRIVFVQENLSVGKVLDEKDKVSVKKGDMTKPPLN